MMDKHFDHILKEKLSRIKVDYDSENWQLLEQRMDAELAGTPPASDVDLDEAVYQKLNHLHVPYNSSHWQQMSGRLDQEFSLIRQILRYKILELSLFGLLLLTIVQYLPIQQNSSNDPWNSHEEQRNTFPSEKDWNKAHSSTQSQEPDRPIAVIESFVSPVAETETEEPYSLAEAHQNELHKNRAIIDNHSSIASPKSMFSISSIENHIKLGEKLQRDNQQHSGLHTQPDLNTPLLKHSFETPEEFFSTTTLAPVYPSLLSYDHQSEDAILDFKPSRQKTFFRVGMFGSADYNRVITPADEELNLNRLSRYTAGYGGGLTFGLEFGRWEVESGLIYAAKQYQARPILFFQGSFRDGYLGKGIKDIEINIINVPLNFRYNFLRNEKWRMYVLGGASLQVAVQANYYTANQDYFRSSSFAPAPAPTSFRQSGLNSFKTLADNLPGGWFEGGSFEENGYLTGNIGLGLERYFSGQWSVFVQPTYQHSINYFLRGLGPTKDEINTLSLYTGIRLRLKK